MTKEHFYCQNEETINSFFFDELCNIDKIFGFDTVPNISKCGLENFKNQAEIKILVQSLDDHPKEVVVNFCIVTSSMYPHDLPDIVLDSENLSKKDLKTLSELISQTAIQLCGRHMLLDLILGVEDWIRENVFKIPGVDSKGNFEESNSNFFKSNDSSVSSISDSELCFSSLIRNGKFISVNSSIASTENLSFESCISHHCGICYTHAIKSSDTNKDFSAHFIRIFKFSKNKFTSDKNGEEFLNFTLNSIMNDINRLKDVVHENIISKTLAFMHSFDDSVYFFIANPLGNLEGLPLCSSIEGLWLKVSEKTVYFMIKQILQALNFLHNLKICHRSVYPCNIKVMSFSKIILSDHGHVSKLWTFWKESQTINNKIKQQIDNHHFSKFSQYFSDDFHSDVFQFGLIVLSLCDCKIYNTSPVHVSQIFNHKLVDFTKRCLDYSKKRRYTTSQLIQHPYMTDYSPTESLWMGAEKENMEFTGHAKQTSTDIDSRLLKEFELIKVIGRGGFGVVILAKNKVDNCIYAVKRITLTKRDWDDRVKIMKEVQILSRLSHPNIVRYYNSWLEKHNIQWVDENAKSFGDGEFDESESPEESHDIDIIFTDNAPSGRFGSVDNTPNDKKDPYPGIIYIYMQMEYCEKQSLRDIIDHDSLYNNQDRLWKFFRDICSGLSYIHSQGMIHRDIKPQNILISSLDQAKIVDFNLATRGLFYKPYNDLKNDSSSKNVKLVPRSVSVVGTVPYAAPEIEEGLNINITTKADLYSFGIVFFEMCHKPFGTHTERYLVINKLKKDFLPPDINEENKRKIIFSLLQTDPKKRLSASDLLVSHLYPVPLDDINIDKVSQHLSNEPFSSHSRKLLQIYFTHDDQVDLRKNYLWRFNQQNIFEASADSHSYNCVRRNTGDFFRRRGCLDFLSPTFIPYNKKTVFSVQPSLCYVDSQGVRVSLITAYLPYLFELVIQQNASDLTTLPISRFGGIHNAFVNEEQTAFSVHPDRENELYYALVCTSKNVIPFLCETICETFSLINHFVIDICSREDSSTKHHVCDSSFESDSVQSLEVHLNHSQLVLSIFSQLGIKKDDQSYLLNQLDELYNLDPRERLAKIEGVFPMRPRLKDLKPILISLFSFEGSISKLEETFNASFRIKFGQQIKVHIDKISRVLKSIKLFSEIDMPVKVTPYLFSSRIWPQDSFIFRCVGVQKVQPHQTKTVTLSTGGVYRYDLEHIRYHGYFALESQELIDKKESKNVAFSDTDDIRLVYSSSSLRFLSSLHKSMHVNKTCHIDSNSVLHERVFLCFKADSSSKLNFPKLHSCAQFLRMDPNNFCVYIYNHPLSYETIRSMHDKYYLLDVGCILCFSPADFSIRIFIVQKINIVEYSVQNMDDAVTYIKGFVSKSVQSNERTNIAIQKSINKYRELRFIFIDETYPVSVQKKYQTICNQRVKSFQSMFNINSEFIVIIVDISNEDYSFLINEISFVPLKDEPCTMPSKISIPRMNDLLTSIKKKMEPKPNNGVYFLFNIKNNKIKHLI